MKVFKINNKRVKGSITVEAAYVMPIILLTIFALIYLAFYLKDINKIQAVTDITLHKAGLTLKHNSDLVTGRVSYEKINERGILYQLMGDSENNEKAIQKYIKKQISGELFVTKVKEIKVKVNNQELIITVKANTDLSLPMLNKLFKPHSVRIISGKYPIHNPAETIRCTEVILETGSSIKGMDKLKDMIDETFNHK